MLKLTQFPFQIWFRKIFSTSSIDVRVSMRMLRSQFKSRIRVILALVAPGTVVARLWMLVTEHLSEDSVPFFEKGFMLM